MTTLLNFFRVVSGGVPLLYRITVFNSFYKGCWDLGKGRELPREKLACAVGDLDSTSVANYKAG